MCLRVLKIKQLLTSSGSQQQTSFGDGNQQQISSGGGSQQQTPFSSENQQQASFGDGSSYNQGAYTTSGNSGPYGYKNGVDDNTQQSGLSDGAITNSGGYSSYDNSKSSLLRIDEDIHFPDDY